MAAKVPTALSPLKIPLKNDRWRLRAAIVLLSLALVAVFISGLLWWQQIILVLAVVAVASWEYHRWQRTQQWEILHCRPSGHWSLQDANKQEVEFVLLPQQLISPWLVIIHGKIIAAGRARYKPGRVLHLWLWKYQTEPDLFRKIAINLKYNQTDSDLS